MTNRPKHTIKEIFELIEEKKVFDANDKYDLKALHEIGDRMRGIEDSTLAWLKEIVELLPEIEMNIRHSLDMTDVRQAHMCASVALPKLQDLMKRAGLSDD